MSADRPHRPQLDSLRAVAVCGVLYTHFVDDDSYLGTLGVRLFFVLSGFLITEIVLRHGRSLDTWKEKRRFLLHFYGRRALRLVPAYYTALLMALVLFGSAMGDVIFWYLLYGPNLLFALRGEWIPPLTAHFWTLGVEEQFYLVWPVVLLALPAVHPACIAAMAIGLSLAYGLLAPAMGVTAFAFNMVPIAQFDALAAGGLLAAYRIDRTGFPAASFAIGIVTLTAVVALYRSGGTQPFWIAQSIAVIPAAALVAAADNGIGGLAGRIATLPPVLAVGRLSYGIYVYHLLVPPVLRGLEARTGLHVQSDGLRLAVVIAMTLIGAWLSWRLMESPVNRLKRFLPYEMPHHGRPNASRPYSAGPV